MQSTTYKRIANQARFHDEGYGYDLFGLDPTRLARVVEIARVVYDRYFRVDSEGIEHIPADGPTIVVANHGGVLPIDGAMLCLDILLRSEPPRIPRAIADHFVPMLPLVGTMFARWGVVSGTRGNVSKLLGRGELVAIWPEGVTGPAKRPCDRYRLQAWRVGFAELAMRFHATVIPVAIVGAEESWPVLAKISRPRPFGAPYLPIPATPIPLPTRFRIRYGEPVTLRFGARDADDPSAVKTVAEDVRVALEALLERALVRREGIFR